MNPRVSGFTNTPLQRGDQTPWNNGNGFNRFHSGLKRCLKFGLCAIIFTWAILFSIGAGASTYYVAHEWGTFTSVQGGDGNLLPWRPLRTSELPGFVYNWRRAGMNRGPLIGFKGDLITLQRMETPVIYFYAEQPMNVDVDVAFPQGNITEWYPQTTQIGPTFAMDTNGSTSGILHESRAIWRNVEIIPESKYYSSLEQRLPEDSSGTHYFAARETTASMVRENLNSPSNSATEMEKFIFYRGAGSFETPLHVTVDSNNLVTIENTGAFSLAHLFLVNIHDGCGAFGIMDELGSSNSVVWLQLTNGPADHWNRFPLASFQTQIGAQMETALVSEGLFPDEAKAMVNTWKDSWFTEPGVRVLYILPRAWTDEILPLKFTPQPNQLTRVMVGRAEIITPDVQVQLSNLLVKAQENDADARLQAEAELKKLGRFAEPALELAIKQTGQTSMPDFVYRLLYPTQSTFE